MPQGHSNPRDERGDPRPPQPAATTAAIGPAVGQADATFEHAGDAIGPYKLLSYIGEGGFGTVWLAERREPMVQRVALKIIKAGMDSKAVIARFEQERQALAVMDHPNIAKVFDAGTTPPAMGSRPYFVMEHVKGEAITSFCDRHNLTIRQRLELFIPVCEAVQHAHMKGIIHRDLKPPNILVSFVGGDDTATAGGSGGAGEAAQPGVVHGAVVKIIDFGVAKAVSHTLTDKTIFTERGQIIGTPEYMSPEQAEMGAVDVDTRTDVYSLGVVLYELLSGALPFDSRDLRSKGYGEIQRIIREVEAPKPSTRLTSLPEGENGAAASPTPSQGEIAQRRHMRLGELVRQLRRELDWVPLMALRKDRRERYQSALAMAEDVRRYLRGEPLVAGPQSAVYRLRKFARRHRTGIAFASVILVLAGAFGGGMYWQVRSRLDAEVRSSADLAEAGKLAKREAYNANIGAAGANIELGNVAEALRRLDLCPADLRGWEWKHLRWKADWSAGRTTLPTPLVGARLSPSGKSFVAFTRSEVIEWPVEANAPSNRWKPRLAGATPGLSPEIIAVATDAPRVVAVDRSGAAPGALVIGDKDAAPRTWTLPDGMMVERVWPSPDGKRGVVLVTQKGTFECVLVDLDAPRVIANLDQGACAWLDASRFVQLTVREIVTRDGETGDVLSRTAVTARRGPDGVVKEDLTLSHDLSVARGAPRLLGVKFNGLWVHDMAAGTADFVCEPPSGIMPTAELSHDGRWAAWPDRGAVVVSDLHAGRSRRFAFAPGVVAAVSLSGDPPAMLVGMIDGSVARADLRDDSPTDWTAAAWRKVYGVGGAPYGATIAHAGSGAGARVIQFEGSNVRGMRECFGQAFMRNAWENVGVRVATGQSDTIERFDSASGESRPAIVFGPSTDSPSLEARSVRELQTIDNSLDMFAVIDCTGDRFVVARIDGQSGAWRSIWRPEGTKADITIAQATESPGVAAGVLNSLCVWDSGIDAAPRTISFEAGVGVGALGFDKAGRRLAIGRWDGQVMILDHGSPTARVLSGGHSSSVRSVVFTPDGSRLLTGSTDGTIIVWEPATGEPLVSLNMEAPIRHLCFPNAQERGVAVLENGSVRYLGVRP